MSSPLTFFHYHYYYYLYFAVLWKITSGGIFSRLMKACLPLECSTHALCESVFWCQAALLG